MKANEIIDLLAEIEEKFEVENWIVDDIHIWPLIRMDLMMGLHFSESSDLQIKINLLFKIKQGMKMLRGYFKYIFAYLRDFKKNAKIRKVDVVLLSNGISRVFLQGKWYDRFCDPLIGELEEKGKTYLMIEPRHNYIIPRLSPSKFIEIGLDFSLVKNMLFKRRHCKKIELNGYEKFVEFIKAKNLNLPIPDIRRLKTIVLAIKSYAEYYRKVLKIAKPKEAYVVCFYGPRGLAFNLACRQMGLKSADIQHGVAGEFNPAYGRWHKVPEKGYELLPAEFLCWTQEDAEAINRWNGKVKQWHKSSVAGNMFVELWKDGNFTNEKTLQNLKNTMSKKNILVTLSYIEDHNAALFENLIEVMKKIDVSWKWWIRLHPCLMDKKNEIKKMFNDEGITNIEVDKATDIALYALLPQMDLHVTYVSATVVEASLFGVKSIMTGKDSKQYFAEQILAGLATYAGTVEELAIAITH